jgi:ribokinase
VSASPRGAQPQLTVVGSINLDLVARVERLPRPGETVTNATLDRIPGGKGATRRSPRLGSVPRCGWSAASAATSSPPKHWGSPRRRSRSRRCANAHVGEFWLDGPALCQLEIPDAAIELARAQADWLCVNAAPGRPLTVEPDLVVANRFELEAIGDQRGLVALTLGAEGAVLLEDGEEVARARPPHVEAVDGTAAGDAFTACLAVSLLEGRDREEALRRACAAGAIAASRFGAQPSLPTRDEVDAILRD